MSEQAIMPLRQDTITVADLLLAVVLLPDGQTGAVLSQLCNALGLSTHSQAQRLRAHQVLRLALVLVQIETSGGPQKVNVILAWGIPLWLAGIRPGGRSPAHRERLRIMQSDVARVLARCFFRAPESATPALPETQAVKRPTQLSGFLRPVLNGCCS